MSERVVRFPSKTSKLGLQSWVRELMALAAMRLHRPNYPRTALPWGDGRTVLLIPGFLSGDWAMTRLQDFLISIGYRVETAHVFFNPGPTAGMIAQLDTTLARLALAGKIDIVGQSLGGMLARSLALRHPQSVRRVVTLCSPIHFPVTTPLEPFARMLAPFHDPEWVARRDEIAGPLPVPVTAIYSVDDGLVDWRQCLLEETPGSENIPIRGAHTTMGSNPKAQVAIAIALGRG